jgi:hypothetical protein
MQAQAQREAVLRQSSKKLLQHSQSSVQSAGAAQDTAAEGLKAGDYEDLAVLAERMAAQQQEIAHLSSQVTAANGKRSELAKVGRGQQYVWLQGMP